MSGLSVRHVWSRAGIAVLVAGAHAGSLAWLTKRVVLLTQGDGEEPVSVEFVRVPAEPAARLAAVEARITLPQPQTPLPRLIALPEASPNPLPEDLQGPPRVRAPRLPAGPPAQLREVESTPAIDTFAHTDAPARRALRIMLCQRLSAHEEARCEAAPIVTVAEADAPGPKVHAEIAPPEDKARGLSPGALRQASFRSGAGHSDHPYRLARLDPAPSHTGMHAIAMTTPGPQAMRDMTGQVLSEPHPVWGD